MEALVLVILEAALSVFNGVAVAVLSGLVTLGAGVAGLLGRWWRSRRPAAARPSSPPAPSVFGRRLRSALLGLGSAIGVTLVLAETVFFQPLVRRVCNAARDRTGIEVGLSRASGSLLSGRVVLHDATLKRLGHPSADFDLVAREFEVDVRLLPLLGGTVSLESARVIGLRGSYVKHAAAEQAPRKPFRADVLLVEDAALDWTLHPAERPPFTVPLRIERLEARPFEGHNAAYSVLFRSDARGTLGGAPFAISGEGSCEARRTTWTAARVPVAVLAGLLGPPFDWVREGSVSLKVTDRWRSGPPLEVDLGWAVVLHEPRAAVPERISGLKRRVAEAVVGFMNRKPREIPLSFTLTLNGDGFKGTMSLEKLALWDAVAEALALELAETSGLPAEVLQEWTRSALEKLKGFLRRKADK